MRVDAGVSAIIAYKLLKAVLEALLGVAFVYLVVRGAEAGAASLAEVLLEHVARNWALAAATLIVKCGTSGHVKFLAALSFGDAVLSAVEGLALKTGRWWAPWLVVVATGALLPWEAFELVVRPTWIRAVLFFVNLAVVVYLLRVVAREHKAARALEPPRRERIG